LKLFTIGDGVSQGFMSAAAARTDLTYSTLIVRSMDLKLTGEYRYPNWEFDGLPLNLERAFREPNRSAGTFVVSDHDLRNMEGNDIQLYEPPLS
jgi:hypothetical protein